MDAEEARLIAIAELKAARTEYEVAEKIWGAVRHKRGGNDDGEREAKRVRRDKAKADVLSREKALEPPQEKKTKSKSKPKPKPKTKEAPKSDPTSGRTSAWPSGSNLAVSVIAQGISSIAASEWGTGTDTMGTGAPTPNTDSDPGETAENIEPKALELAMGLSHPNDMLVDDSPEEIAEEKIQDDAAITDEDASETERTIHGVGLDVNAMEISLEETSTPSEDAESAIDKSTGGCPPQVATTTAVEMRAVSAEDMNPKAGELKPGDFHFPSIPELVASMNNERTKEFSVEMEDGHYELSSIELGRSKVVSQASVNPGEINHPMQESSAGPGLIPSFAIDPSLLSSTTPPQDVVMKDTIEGGTVPVSPRESAPADNASDKPPLGGLLTLAQNAKTTEAINTVTAQRADYLRVIESAEFNLCSPKQRTMDEIRAELNLIDQGYRNLNAADIRLEELRQIALAAEKDREAKAARKPMLERRKILKKKRESLVEEIAKAGPDEVPKIQREMASIKEELEAIEMALSPPKAKKGSKSEKGRTKPSGNPAAQVASDDYRDDDLLGTEEDDRKAVEAFNNLSPEGKTELAAETRKSIHAYTMSQEITDFKVGHRRNLRILQGLLPDEALRSTSVALAIHTNSAKNTVCRFHSRYQKTKIHDGVTLNLVEGVAYLPVYGSFQLPAKPYPGCMNCGCLIEDVLYDFYFWKTWTVVPRRPDLAGRSETMKCDVLRPRVRAFVIDMFKKFTKLTLDDLYGGYGLSRPMRENVLAMRSIQRLVGSWQESTGVPVTLEIHANPESQTKVEEVVDN